MDTLKKQARDVRKGRVRAERRERRAIRRRRRRCFWARPWGHEFVNLGTEEEPFFACVSCDQPRGMPPARASGPAVRQ